MDIKSNREASHNTFFGANCGNAVQMGMRTDRLPQYTPLRLSSVARADLVPRGAWASSLMRVNPGDHSAGAHYA